MRTAGDSLSSRPVNDTSPTRAPLQRRFRDVLHYIDAHLDTELNGEQLSAVACLSRFHFHRQFSGFFGIGVAEYVKLTRLKRASYQLAFRPNLSVIDIALLCGFEGPEAFARSFKKKLAQSPTAFRTQPDWSAWAIAFQPLQKLRMDHMNAERRFEDVRMVTFQDTRVAVLEHRGDPAALPESIRKFIAWRREHRLPPAKHATFNILYDDPVEVRPDEFRLDLCVATDMEEASIGSGMVAKVIPGGRCALVRHTGSDETLGETIRWLYAKWLPASSETPRDFPLFVKRERFFPDVPEHEAVTDVYLPIE